VEGGRLSVKGKSGTVTGTASEAPAAGMIAGVADAAAWNDLDKLIGSAGKETQAPIAIMAAKLPPGPLYLALQDAASGKMLDPPALAQAFQAAQSSRHEIATRLVVDTPDPFINAAAPALCIAADAVWDEASGTVMHGGVAWRNKLLGWRGPYSLDEMGWHDRMIRQITYWAGQQITSDAIPDQPHADAAKNLATDDWKMLHTNGAMSKSHYDMNLAYVDYYLRHALWTGDVELLKKTWPMLQRHLAWEQRCFRRLYGAQGQEKLPLYEAYAAIWASDNLQYDGGGTAHASALNYFDNKMAARIATLIGEDGAPYEKEAGLILRAMKRELWMPEKGIFAEFKDLLPPQTLHDAPALWTYYHTVDSEVADPFEAYQMGRYVDTQLAHLPIHGEDVPEGTFVLASTNWMPYIWSINNIVLGENAATALADWQANRPRQGFATFKGNVLDSMFMGLCPGNTHMASFFDSYRSESQRDFADPTAIMSRALVEGLFGIRPDLIAGTVTIQPGFPAAWDHATLSHPDLSLSFKRTGQTDTYTVEPHFGRPVQLRLALPARADRIASVMVNGAPAQPGLSQEGLEVPQLKVTAAPAEKVEVTITWAGDPLVGTPADATVEIGGKVPLAFGKATVLEVSDPQHALNMGADRKENWATATAVAPGYHTIFAKIHQGDFTWWMPVNFDARPACEIMTARTQEAGSLHFVLRNNSAVPLDQSLNIGAAALRLRAGPRGGQSEELSIPLPGLLPGTNALSFVLSNGLPIDGTVQNWLSTPPAGTKFEPLDLSPIFNANVTDIFKTEYLSPRSPYVSLSIPRQGIGGWADNRKQADINDAGLRGAKGELVLQGIPFKTPAEGKNIAFTSYWDNHPKALSLPLTGNARHLYLLMAGSTNSMRSRMENGRVQVLYQDGSTALLTLDNPTTWWPIDQDYLVDDYAFALRAGGNRGLPPLPLPPRVDLATGKLRILDNATFPGTAGGSVRGGAATLLDLPLDPRKSLQSLTVKPSTNEVVIGLLSATLVR
jgi:hypothetical protein